MLSLHGSGAKKSLLLPCLQTAEGQEQPHPARRGRNLWVTVPPRAQKFWDLCATAMAAMPAASAQQHRRLGLVQPCIFFNLSTFIWFDLFKIIFNTFSECTLAPFFLVRDLSKAGAEGKYYQPSWDFYHVQGFCGSPVPTGTIHPHSHTDKAKKRVCSGHSAPGVQHPTLSLAGCYLCVTTKALLVTCLCPCFGATRRTLGRTCPPAAGGSANGSDNFILLCDRDRTSSSNFPHFQASPC